MQVGTLTVDDTNQLNSDHHTYIHVIATIMMLYTLAAVSLTSSACKN